MMNTVLRKLMMFCIALLCAGVVQASDIRDADIALIGKDYATALKKYKVVAAKSDSYAQLQIGSIYYEGLGVKQDYTEAVRWFSLAAAQGLADAQTNLGLCYSKGEGVVQDYAEALRWYKLAAAQGNLTGQFNLGASYAKGEGVPTNYIRAHMWFNLAAARGDADSAKNRDIAAAKMTARQIEQAQRMARECMSSNFTKCD